MGCWSSKPPKRCEKCYNETDSLILNKCRLCYLAENTRLSSTYTYSTPTQSVARNHVHGALPQLRPKTVNDAQFGQFYCKPCGRSWKSLRSWPNKYQMCKRCKKPVYPSHCRELKSSDYTSSKEDSKEHEIKLCEMCQQLGHSCKNFGKGNKRKVY